MSSSYGKILRVTLFGQSHGPAIGVTVEGLPAGHRVDLERLNRFLARRAPGRASYTSARKEADEPEFLSGLSDGYTCGAPLTAVIRNTDARSSDYSSFARTPRPGHADYTGRVKYGPHADLAGGGHFSGRLTAALCVAGGVCLQLLEEEGVQIFARIASVAGIRDEGPWPASVAEKEFPTVSDESGAQMRKVIAAAGERGDSVGGVVECAVLGLPAGVGDPMFDGMENRLASVLFGIPAVKGVEFGTGFAAAESCGSANNDAFALRDGKVVTLTNRCGGILGGITTGMPVEFRAAFKPTPSIALQQQSVDLESGSQTEISVTGRHDPCIVPRAVPCVEVQYLVRFL